MERRQHDMFMDMAYNPGATFDNLVVAGLTANNTSLQDRSVYENDDWVREQFKDEYGEFDKLKFSVFYNNAKMYYNLLANANYDESMRRLATYHRDNIFAPIELRREGPEFKEVLVSNPFQTTSGIIELGKVGERTKSIDELAQSNRVLLNPTTAGDNLENALWGDTPNDSFWKYFTSTLVLAQYDTDGTHIDQSTGETVEHKAGDLKLDNTGNFYYEKLDGRDIYGRRVLNKMNVLTRDGSWANQFDFFDSDDLQLKSFVGSTLKNLALVGSMFLPYVGPWIAGISVVTLLAGLTGTLGKMLTGSDSPVFSELEGWSKSVGRQGATSEYAQEHTWCWENFINLIGDVAGLLKEQRFIFERIPMIFKGSNMMSKEMLAAKLKEFELIRLNSANIKMEELRKTSHTIEELTKAESELRIAANLKAQADLESFIKGYNRIGEVLSKGYMTAITVGDTYGEAKLAGASDIDATLLTLGYAASEYALLNTGLGEWIMPELRAGRYKSQAIFNALTKANRESQDLWKELGIGLKNIPKEGKKEYAKKLFNIGKNIARAEYSNGTRTAVATAASAAGEGFEEVSEEFLADFSKGCYDVVKWLLGDSTRVNTFGYDFKTEKWNPSEILDRYGMSLIGGAIGGGLTNLGTNYDTVKSLNNMTSKQAMEELVYMARNGEAENLIREVNRMLVGDTNLSTDFTIEGNSVIFEPGTKENNLDLFIKKAFTNLVRLVESFLQANGAVSDSEFLDALTLKDLRFTALRSSTTAGAYLQEYNSLLTKIVKLSSDINKISDKYLDTNKDGVVTDREERNHEITKEELETINKFKAELKETKKKLDDLLAGKRSYEFVATSLFEMTPALSGIFTTPTFTLYAELMYGRKYSELTDDDKERARLKYKEWITTDARERLQVMSDVYRRMAEQTSQVIKNHELEYLQTSEDLLSLTQFISNLYNFKLSGDLDWTDLAQGAVNSASGNLLKRFIKVLGTEEDWKELLDILKRTPVEGALEEDILKFKELRKNDYINKLEDVLLNNIEAYIAPFILRGFANAETKNLLYNLLSWAKDVAGIKSGKFDEDDSNYMVLVNPYQLNLTTISNLISLVKSLNNTPLEQNLNEFAIATGNEPINLTELVLKLNESLNNTSDNITNFNLDEQLSLDLENAIETLLLYLAAILGARTDAANLNNIYGYNATLNEVLKKVGGTDYQELAEIDSHAADVFIEDINNNLNKLLFLKQLYAINKGLKLSRLDRVATRKDLLIYKRLKNIVQVLDDDDLKNWNGFLDLLNAINGMTIHEDLLQSKKSTVEKSKREDFELEKLKAENAIYEFFLKNQDKLNSVLELAKFLNPKRLLLYTEAKELLNEGLEDLDDNSLVWWLATRVAVRSQDFYNIYKLVIDPDGNISPIATLELAIYNNYASIVNGNVFTAFYNAYRYSIVEDWKNKPIDERRETLRRLGKSDATSAESPISEVERLAADNMIPYALNFLPKPRYSNIVLTEGIPGSGKSSGVYQTTLKLLRQHPDILKKVVVVHGADSKSAEKLRSDIGLTSDNSTAYGREDFMKREINSTWKEYSKNADDIYEVPTSDFTITSENEIRSNLSVNSTTTPPSLIIIDEISNFSAYDLDLIDKFAQQHGITVLAAGDFDQTGVIGGHKVTLAGQSLDWYISLDRTDFIRAPKLGVSMRTDNSLKTTNLQIMQAYMLNPVGVAEFKYYLGEDGLYGDKVYIYSDNKENILNNHTEGRDLLKDIDSLIATLNKGEKIGYIYSDTNSPIYQKLNEDAYKLYIDFKKGGSAQGLEGQYYIIEANPTVSQKKYLTDIYTGMSRAQLGSIIIAPKDYAGVKFGDSYVSEKITEKISKLLKVSFAKNRKLLLEKIVPNGNDIAVLPRLKPVPVPVPKNPDKGLGPATDPTPPPTTPPPTTPPTQQPSLLPVLQPSLLPVLQPPLLPVLQPPVQQPTLPTQLPNLDLPPIPPPDLFGPPVDPHNEPPQTPPAVTTSEPYGPPIDPLTGQPIVPPDVPPIDPHNEVTNLPAPADITTEPANKEPEIPSLVYEDDINPIALPDIIAEEDYKEAIDTSTEEENPARSKAEMKHGRIIIDMLLHTFNTFELGVLIGEDGMPIINQWTDARIDSINGLLKIDKLLHQRNSEHPEIRPVYGKAGYVLLIGNLRSAIFNILDKAKLCEEIQKILGIDGIYCTFALKSSPTISLENRRNGVEYLTSRPNPFEKSSKERTDYNGSNDTRSNEWHPKSVTIIIGTEADGNLLELPLIALSSPITLMKVKNEDGMAMYGPILNRWASLKNAGYSSHEIILGKTDRETGRQLYQGLVSEFGQDPKYKEIIDLFKLHDFTDGAVFYIEDNQWTPAQDLLLIGPQVVLKKGYYQEEDGFFMNDSTNPESEWMTLELLKENPLITMTDDILVSIDLTDTGKKLAKTGHPFVLVSFNKKLNTSKKIIDLYIAQQNNSSIKKLVKLVYVLPPKASIRSYLNNLHKILVKDNNVENIGNLFTSYKLLKQLIKNPDFRNLMEAKSKGLLQKVEKAILELDALPDTVSLKDALYTPDEWKDLGFPTVKLAGLLDGALMNVAYTRNTLPRYIGGEAVFDPDEAAISLIELILLNNEVNGEKRPIDGVYYRVKVPKLEVARMSGPFHVPILGDDYTMYDKPVRIHGKIDSYTFIGNMSWLVDMALSKLRPLPSAPGHYYSVDNTSYWKYRSNLTSLMSAQESVEHRKIRNLSEYVLRKTGLDVTDRYGNGRTIQEVNTEIVNEINNSDNGFVAFTIGDEIRISSQSNYLRGSISVYNGANFEGGYPDSNLTKVDNNGNYSLTIQTSVQEDGVIGYDATYDSIYNQLSITPIYSNNSLPSTAQIPVTPENITQYLETGRALLQPLFEEDFGLEMLFNTSTYEEFLGELELLEYLGEDRINNLQNLLNGSLDENLILLINDLIAFELSNNPDNIRLCPPTIRIKF